MPPQSRAQRRRQAQRSGQRPPRAASTAAPVDTDIMPLELPEATEPDEAVTTVATPRPARQGRRSAIRTPEPTDYSQEYAYVRRDLIRIGLISALILIAMVALGFSGLI